MSRKLAVLLAMVVLVGSMGLKTAVASHTDGNLTVAIGGAPPPPMPYSSIGGAPPPPMPYSSIGGAPPPPMPYSK